MDRSPSPSIVLLTAGGPLGAIAANGLLRRLGSLRVIEETAETKAEIIRRRARILGWRRTLSQVAFGIAIRGLKSRSNRRLAEVVADHGLDPTLSSNLTIDRVPSVNSEACRELLKALAPKVVAVYGTRLIAKATLNCVDAPFINYHAGITPAYRGQHPAYWARVDGRPDLAGVTIHLVDQGVDTGGVIYQAPTSFSPRDTISTYQYLQMATALPMFTRAIEDALAGRLVVSAGQGRSRNHFPPTLGAYLANGFSKGIW